MNDFLLVIFFSFTNRKNSLTNHYRHVRSLCCDADQGHVHRRLAAAAAESASEAEVVVVDVIDHVVVSEPAASNYRDSRHRNNQLRN